MTLIDPKPVNDSAVAAISAIHASNAAHAQMMADRAGAVAAIQKSNASRETYVTRHEAALEAIEAADDTARGLIAVHANDRAPEPIPDPDRPVGDEPPTDRPPVAEAALSLMEDAA